jgi:integral membrane protein
MRTADIPRIRLALAFFKVSAIVTGVFLLLLVVMMICRYGLGADIELGGPEGFLALTPKDLITGVNLSTIILIVHGWLYVVYLGLDFILWRLIRWSFAKFLFIALGGVIPALSFYLERRVPRDAQAEIDRTQSETTATAKVDEGATA